MLTCLFNCRLQRERPENRRKTAENERFVNRPRPDNRRKCVKNRSSDVAENDAECNEQTGKVRLIKIFRVIVRLCHIERLLVFYRNFNFFYF